MPLILILSITIMLKVAAMCKLQINEIFKRIMKAMTFWQSIFDKYQAFATQTVNYLMIRSATIDGKVKVIFPLISVV